MRISLVGSSHSGVTVSLDSQATINLMEEFSDSKAAKSPSALIATPGLRKLLDIGHDTTLIGSPVIGALELPIPAGASLANLLVIAGNRIYRIEPDNAYWLATNLMQYTATYVGPISAVNITGLAKLSQSDTSVFISAPSAFGYVYTIATGALSAAVVFDATPGNFALFSDIAFLEGYWIGTGPSGSFQKLYYSTDPSAWDSTDFFAAEADNSQIRRTMVKNGHLWVFKQKSIQPFVPTGDANNPFAPIQGATIQFGCRTQGSVVQLGDNFYWLGSDQEVGGFIVYRTEGVTAKRVSNSFVESKLQHMHDAYGPIAILDINAYGCVERGRPLYKMHCIHGRTTLVYDELSGEWHERRWWNALTGQWEAEVGWVHSNLNGFHVVGDRRQSLYLGQIGAMYLMSEQYPDNDIWPDANTAAHSAGSDTFIKRQRISPHFSGPNGERLFIDSVELDFERGLPIDSALYLNGVLSSLGAGVDPQVSLSVSVDGGRTYGMPRTRSIGKVGEYKKKCMFNGLGSGFDIVFKIDMTDAASYKLVGAIAQIGKGT